MVLEVAIRPLNFDRDKAKLLSRQVMRNDFVVVVVCLLVFTVKGKDRNTQRTGIIFT